MKNLLTMVIILIPGLLAAAPNGSCNGTNKDAVTELPGPLNHWAQVICTPYGHAISNRAGWVWESPEGLRPVIAMIPSQMVKSNPKRLGNESYFKEITLERATPAAASRAISKFEKGFSKQSKIPSMYTSKIVSTTGQELEFQFFEYEDDRWGMYCDKNCGADFRFMILNSRMKRLSKPR